MGVDCASLDVTIGMRGGARDNEGRTLVLIDTSGRIAGINECVVTMVEPAVREVFDPWGAIESTDNDIFRVSDSRVGRPVEPLRCAPGGDGVDELELGTGRRSNLSCSRTKLSNILLRTHFPTLTAQARSENIIGSL